MAVSLPVAEQADVLDSKHIYPRQHLQAARVLVIQLGWVPGQPHTLVSPIST